MLELRPNVSLAREGLYLDYVTFKLLVRHGKRQFFWQSLNGADCQDGWGKLITINAFSFHFISKSGEIFPQDTT